MDNKTRKYIELAIIRLENENQAKYTMLNFLHGKLPERMINTTLDEINANLVLISKLKKGLEPEGE